MKKYIILIAISFIVLGGIFTLAQAQEDNTPPVQFPQAGLTPEDTFYFLDQLLEIIQEFVTFNSEAKARLQVTFAAERVAEIRIMLDDKGVKAKGIEVAQSRLLANITKAVKILAEKQSKGEDILDLAEDLNNQFEDINKTLKETLKEEERELKEKKKELKNAIEEMEDAGNETEKADLILQLNEIETQLELLKLERKALENALDEREEELENKLEADREALKKIQKADREKEELVKEAEEEGVTLPGDAFVEFDDLRVRAKTAFDAESFEEAKKLAQLARKSLRSIEDTIDENNDEEENNKMEKKDIDNDDNNTPKLKESSGKANNEEQEDEISVKVDDSSNSSKDTNKAEGEGEVIKSGDSNGDTEEVSSTQKQNESPVASDESPVVPEKSPVKVIYTSNGFSPATVTIKIGETVQFENESSGDMWVASDLHPTHTIYRAFDQLTSVGNGEKYEFTFTQVGSWTYHNHRNAGVSGGKIIVQ